MKMYISATSKGVTSSTERNDCTVRALANATGISYEEAHEHMQKYGRKSTKGSTFETIIPAYEEQGLTLTKVCGSTKPAKFIQTNFNKEVSQGMTIKKFLDSCNPNKKYVIIAVRHAFAVVNQGIVDITDYNKANSRVIAVFEKS